MDFKVDGGEDVREDATDWYLRARSDLLKSLLDGYDYYNSIANYILATENLENHGYEIIKGHNDLFCDMVVKEEEKSIEDMMASESREERRQGRARRVEAERSKMIEGGRERDEAAFMFSGGAETIPNHHWKDRFPEASVHDFVSLWPDAPMKEDSLYSDAHRFQKEYHPLLTVNSVTGLPAYIETLRDFYLPPEPGAQSMAERVKRHESMHENHYGKRNNASITGIKDEITGEVTYPFKGPLHDSHLHDLYLDNLETWKKNNQDLVNSITNEYENPAEQDFAIAQAHMEDAIKGWMSQDLNEENHRTSLGWGGYNLGLEFLSPSQRDNVVAHLMQEGSNSEAAQKINIDGDKGRTISVGRIKRNLAHRFSPEFFSEMRNILHTSQNQRSHVEGGDDFRDITDHDSELLFNALHEAKHEEHGTMADAIIAALNEKHSVEEGELPLDNLRALRSLGEAKSALDSQQVIANMMDKRITSSSTNKAALLHLLGLKQTKDGYEVSTKGHFDGTNRPLGIKDMEELDKIDRKSVV